MSEPGDVVWADGRAWMRRHDSFGGSQKLWWMTCRDECYEWNALANLKQHDDFEWLVKDGIPIVLNALAVYHALDSFADFVAKRGADAALTAERDELLSRLAEMTAQRDTLAEQLGAEIGNREAAEWQLAKVLARSGELAKVTATCDNFESLYYEAEHRKGELVAERTVLLGELAEMTAQRDRAVAKGSELAADLVESERQHDEARDEERAAIVAWLHKDPQGWARQWSLAGRIERGEHDV